MVFGKHFAAETGSLTRIRGFIGDRPAGSYRIFQACQESFAGPAALHVFLHLEAERVVQLFVEVIGKFREHLLAASFARVNRGIGGSFRSSPSTALILSLGQFLSNEEPRPMQAHPDRAWPQARDFGDVLVGKFFHIV